MGLSMTLKAKACLGRVKTSTVELLSRHALTRENVEFPTKSNGTKTWGNISIFGLEPATKDLSNFSFRFSKWFGDAMDVRTRYCNFSASPGIYSYLELCGLNHTRCEIHFPQALESLQLVTIPSIYKKISVLKHCLERLKNLVTRHIKILLIHQVTEGFLKRDVKSINSHTPDDWGPQSTVSNFIVESWNSNWTSAWE